MKNIVVGLIALPAIAIVIVLVGLFANVVLAGVVVVSGLIATFGPLVLGGVLATGIVFGVLYLIGKIVRCVTGRS